MKINKKLLGFGTLALPIVVVASMFFAMNPNTGLFNRVKAADENFSITFNRSSTVKSGSIGSANVQLSTKLVQSGYPAYAQLKGTTFNSAGTSDIFRITKAEDEAIFSVDQNYGIARFRSIVGIKLTYNSYYSDKTFNVLTSSNGVDYVSTTITGSEEVSFPSLSLEKVHYLKFGYANNKTCYFNTISIYYSCSEEEEVVLDSISVSNQTTEFNVGDSFEFDGQVTAHYSDDTTEIIENGFSVSEPDMSTSGTKEVTVSYQGKTTSYLITINEEEEFSIVGKTYYSSYEYYGTIYSMSIEFLDETNGIYRSSSSSSTGVVYFIYVVNGSGNVTFTKANNSKNTDDTEFGRTILFGAEAVGTSNTSSQLDSDHNFNIQLYRRFGTTYYTSTQASFIISVN